ncbi:MAG: hypothetical protein ACOYJD_09785, partial [Christensenellales bacterium]
MILAICIWLAVSALSASGAIDGYLKMMGVSRTAACAFSLAIAAAGVPDTFSVISGLDVVPGTALAVLLAAVCFIACSGG